MIHNSGFVLIKKMNINFAETFYEIKRQEENAMISEQNLKRVENLQLKFKWSRMTIVVSITTDSLSIVMATFWNLLYPSTPF